MDPATPSREVWGWWRVTARDDRGEPREVHRIGMRESWALRRQVTPEARAKWSRDIPGPSWRDMWPQVLFGLAIPFPWALHTVLSLWLTSYTAAGPVRPNWLPANFPLWWYLPWCVLCVLAQIRWGPLGMLRWAARHSLLRLPAGACLACGFDLRAAASESDGCTVCPECGAAWRIARADHATGS